MRADRLLAMLMILQTRGRTTAPALAAELEVSERTIYRDINALGTAGVPICAARGPGGGIWLIESYRSDLTGLNKAEVQALFMLSIPPALSDLGLDKELKAALLKLSAALPATLRGNPQQVRQRLHIDPQPWAQQPRTELPHLPAVQQAVWHDRVLAIRYYSLAGQWVGPLAACFHPYGLVSKGGTWHLVGFRRDHLAVLRVADLLDVQITAARFTRPADFDLVDFWAGWCRTAAQNRPYLGVVARVASQLLPLLPQLFGPGILARVQAAGPPDPQGWITLELPFEDHDQARARLLPLGGAVEVLSPLALRYSIQDYAAQILAVYSDRASITTT